MYAHRKKTESASKALSVVGLSVVRSAVAVFLAVVVIWPMVKSSVIGAHLRPAVVAFVGTGLRSVVAMIPVEPVHRPAVMVRSGTVYGCRTMCRDVSVRECEVAMLVHCPPLPQLAAVQYAAEITGVLGVATRQNHIPVDSPVTVGAFGRPLHIEAVEFPLLPVVETQCYGGVVREPYGDVHCGCGAVGDGLSRYLYGEQYRHYCRYYC